MTNRKYSIIIFFVSITTVIVLLMTDYYGLIKRNELDSTAKVTYIEQNSYNNIYEPTYYYLIQNNEYSCYSKSNGFFKKVEKNPKVYYDSKDPLDCLTSYDTYLGWYDYLTISLVILLFIISIISIIISFRKKDI